jgi:hypothetical protein
MWANSSLIISIHRYAIFSQEIIMSNLRFSELNFFLAIRFGYGDICLDSVKINKVLQLGKDGL